MFLVKYCLVIQVIVDFLHDLSLTISKGFELHKHNHKNVNHAVVAKRRYCREAKEICCQSTFCRYVQNQSFAILQIQYIQHVN